MDMPRKSTKQRAKRDQREGKSESTQAGEFVGEEMEHVREGKHGARNPKQAIAIGLSKARRAGTKVPRRGKSSSTKKSTSGRGKTSTRGRRGSTGGRRGGTSKRGATGPRTSRTGRGSGRKSKR